MLYFIRHGESELRGKFVGPGENPKLTERGRQQALDAAQFIKDQQIEISSIVASPMKRTLETARIIAQAISFDTTKIVADKRVTEYDVGSYKGKPKQGVQSLQLVSAEGAENPQRFKERVQKCVEELARLPGNVLLISHNVVFKMLETIRTNSDVRLFYDRPESDNAVVMKLDWLE